MLNKMIAYGLFDEDEDKLLQEAIDTYYTNKIQMPLVFMGKKIAEREAEKYSFTKVKKVEIHWE